MAGFPENLYQRWRKARSVPAQLRDQEPRQPPPERLLQLIWMHQRLRRDDAHTTDGRPVVVLHPGFWNREAGPDFREAVIQIGEPPARVGDVEVDLCSGGWSQHQHQANPAYRNVILHVVWESAGAGSDALPTMAVREWIDAPLAELECWLGGLNAADLPPALRGACVDPLSRLAGGGFEEMLRQAARVRLEQKAARFRARARHAGWEQALWEGLFGALGYKHNVWALRRLAELLPRFRASVDGRPLSARRWQVLLLGVAGLLPDALDRSSRDTDAFLSSLWNEWWRERARFAEDLIPRGLWRFHGMRPANHPARRLALAAHWLADPTWLDRLEGWLAEDIPDRRLPATLLERWQVAPHDYWSWHWTLRSGHLARPRPWLGLQRVTDLAMNVVLPWLWSRAGTGGDPALLERAEHRYFAWPVAQDNAVLRLARQRLLAGRSLPKPRRAADQQGMLQIVRDFCDHANALCQSCPFPDLVNAADLWGGQPGRVD